MIFFSKKLESLVSFFSKKRKEEKEEKEYEQKLLELAKKLQKIPGLRDSSYWRPSRLDQHEFTIVIRTQHELYALGPIMSYYAKDCFSQVVKTLKEEDIDI